MADFGFGNIVYLILIVIFAIYSSQKKKRKKEAALLGNTANQPSNIKSFFEELLNSEQTTLVPEPQIEYFDEPEPEVKIETPIKPVIEKKEKKISKKVKIDAYSQEIVTESEIDFDLREAVINSELLNRKYFWPTFLISNLFFDIYSKAG